MKEKEYYENLKQTHFYSDKLSCAAEELLGLLESGEWGNGITTSKQLNKLYNLEYLICRYAELTAELTNDLLDGVMDTAEAEKRKLKNE